MKYKEKQLISLERTVTYYINENIEADKFLFLLNGFAGPGPQFWINLYRDIELTKEYKIISMDYFGSGKSVEHTNQMYKLNDILETIKKIIDNEQCKKGYMVGLSFGCLVALKFSFMYSNILDGMILFSPVFGITEIYNRTLKGAKRMLQSGIDLEKIFELLFPWAYNDEEYEKIRQNEKEINRKFAEYNTPEGMINLIQIMLELEFDNMIEKIETQVLMVVGANDKISPIENQIILNKSLKKSNLEILPKSGHIIGFENSKLINLYIKKLIYNTNGDKLYE